MKAMESTRDLVQFRAIGPDFMRKWAGGSDSVTDSLMPNLGPFGHRKVLSLLCKNTYGVCLQKSNRACVHTSLWILGHAPIRLLRPCDSSNTKTVKEYKFSISKSPKIF